MLPPVTQLLSVEMVRDGGSLAATFRGGNSSEYWLFFPVKIETIDPDHETITGWNLPLILERSTGLQNEVSWQHAISFIGKLKPQARDPKHLALLDAMAEIAGASGGVTSSVLAIYPSIDQPWRVIHPPKKAG